MFISPELTDETARRPWLLLRSKYENLIYHVVL